MDSCFLETLGLAFEKKNILGTVPVLIDLKVTIFYWILAFRNLRSRFWKKEYTACAMLPWLSGRRAAAGGRGGRLKRRTKSSRYPSGNFLSTGILFLWYILLWYINGPLERIISLKGLAPWRSRIDKSIRFLGGATPLPDIQVHLPSPPDSIRILHGRRSISEVALGTELIDLKVNIFYWILAF